jgi:hypothetical protein
LSHILSYVLKHHKNITTAVIIGFITGSLGVVWPWKKTILKTDALGNVLIDTNGNEIILNYERFIPDMGNMESWWAIFYMVLGAGILLGLERYGRYRSHKK